MASNVDPKLMSIPQVANTGLLTAYTLRKMLKDGNLPVVRVGRKVLINYEALVAQLDAATAYGTDNSKSRLW